MLRPVAVLVAVSFVFAVPGAARSAITFTPAKQQATGGARTTAQTKKKARAKKATNPVKRAKLLIGIADQKEQVFNDPRFRALKIRYARRAVAWDALTVDWQRDELDRWMERARSLGIQPLITMEHSRQAGRTRIQPTVEELMVQFRELRARYPWVTDYSAWNEANCNCQATFKRPELVAEYWKRMQAACATCRVLGADLLDVKGMERWLMKFLAAAGSQPRYWGLHNYVSANRFESQAVQNMLSLTRGELWLTETGGLVARRNKSKIKLPEGADHAAKVTAFILGPLVAASPRITRAYFYQWSSSGPADSWDSSFVSWDGVLRPALDIIKKAQGVKGPLPPAAPPAPSALEPAS